MDYLEPCMFREPFGTLHQVADSHDMNRYLSSYRLPLHRCLLPSECENPFGSHSLDHGYLKRLGLPFGIMITL